MRGGGNLSGWLAGSGPEKGPKAQRRVVVGSEHAGTASFKPELGTGAG